jgi:hypothetical protein
MSETYDRLLAHCKNAAEEVQSIGKTIARTCGDCENCLAANGKEIVYYCSAKSEADEFDDEHAVDDENLSSLYYRVDPDDDYDSEEHGDYNWRTKETGPCEYFTLKDSVPEVPYYEDAYAWLEDQLDVEFVSGADGKYRHGIVCTATGGPHIEVDTRQRRVKGFWGTTSAEWYLDGDASDMIDVALEEMFESTTR